MKRIVIEGVAKMIIILGIILFVISAQAQTEHLEEGIKRVKKDYFGFAVSVGTRSSTLSSNYSAIDKMQVSQEGGSIGVLWGSKGIQTRLSGGYYSSTDNVAHTTDLIQVELSTNLYPLYMIFKKSYILEPFFTTGINRNSYKMYGFYTNEQSASNNNFSVTIEPYLGSLNSYNALVGAGVEINLLDQYEFCKLFVDARYSSPLKENSSRVFSNTLASAQLNINVGIIFGTNRFYSPKHYYGR